MPSRLRQQISKRTQTLSLLFLLIAPIATLSAAPLTAESTKKADKIIGKLYHHLDKKLTLSQRLSYFSGYFLGRPYRRGPLGEGAGATYNQNPLYRTDSFDCTTYVSTVLALSLSSNLDEFKSRIKRIRYQSADVSFAKRNHFMSADWNKTNQRLGHTVDITSTIVNDKGRPIALRATTTINKPQWFQKQTIKQIVLPTGANKQAALKALHLAGAKQQKERVTIDYLPLVRLYTKDKVAIKSFFKQIPSGSIIEIVRPSWDLVPQIGTKLHVSHVGFAIRKNNQLYFREASPVYKSVVDIPLSQYLKSLLLSKTIKGINVQQIIKRKERKSAALPVKG